MIIYHGTDHIIEVPVYGKGKKANDFGLGFYCTESEQLSKEWASSPNCVGYSNKYVININHLNIMRLSDKKYNLLNWLALLLKNRDFKPKTYEGLKNKEYIINNFYPDLSSVDIIIGYRADDSYFSWAKDFIGDNITLEQLEEAMHFGQLGEQVVLISKKSFEEIQFNESYKVTEIWYHNMRIGKEKEANIKYSELLMKEKDKNDYFIIEIPMVLDKYQKDILDRLFYDCYIFQNKLISYAKSRIYVLNNSLDYCELRKQYTDNENKLEKYRIQLNSSCLNESEINDIKKRVEILNKNCKRIITEMNNFKVKNHIPFQKYDLGKQATIIKNKYNFRIPPNFANTLSQNVAMGCKKIVFGGGKSLHYKKLTDINYLTGKHTNKDIIFDRKNEVCYFKFNSRKTPKNSIKKYIKRERNKYDYKNHIDKTFEDLLKPYRQKELTFKLNIYNDFYLKEAISDESKIKYCGFKRKLKNTRYVYYLSLTIIGLPPKIKNKIGQDKYMLSEKLNDSSVGIDIGTSSIAIVSENKVDLTNLGPDQFDQYEEKIQSILSYMNRSRRITNPNNYNDDGTYKKGTRIMNVSKRYKKAQKKLRYLYQAKSVTLRNNHRHLANKIIYEFGTDVRIEEMNFKALQKKVKKTERQKKVTVIEDKKGNHKEIYKYKKKKRFGKSINRYAPALFVNILSMKLNYVGSDLHIINTKKVKASQYNHVNDNYTAKKLNERINIIEGAMIQRDLYSAFLIKNTNNSFDEIERGKCIKEFENFKIMHDRCIDDLINKKIKNSSIGLMYFNQYTL